MRRLMLFVFLAAGMHVYSQEPTVRQKFDHLYASENFDSINAFWTTVSNADNLLIVQEGEYIMHRKASFSPYAILAGFPDSLGAYRLVTSLKLDKVSAEEGSIGIIFMAQKDGSGGFMLELNRKEQYRIRKISGKTYITVTGTPENSGWIAHPAIKGLGIPNLIEIHTANGNYDVFINNSLAKSFEDHAYAAGAVGFIIGPASKGRSDFIYIFTSSEGDNKDKIDSDEPSGADIIALAESIIALKTQINKLEEQNTDLKNIVEGFRMASKDADNASRQLKAEIETLNLRLKNTMASFDSLRKENEELQKYKDMVRGHDDGDIVINLSKSLKNEKLANEKLSETNKMLTDSIQVLINKLKSGSTEAENKMDNEKNPAPAETPKLGSEFILPEQQ